MSLCSWGSGTGSARAIKCGIWMTVSRLSGLGGFTGTDRNLALFAGTMGGVLVLLTGILAVDGKCEHWWGGWDLGKNRLCEAGMSQNK